MAKINNREDALLQAYLSQYKAAQDSAVTGGQKNTQKAQRQGSAILNATDKTLPSLGNSYESTLKNIVSGVSTENSLNLDFMNRQVKLAKAQYDAAQDYAKQMKKAQSYAAKAAAKATKRRTRKGNTAGQNTSTDLSNTASNALNGLNSSGTNANNAKPNGAKPNSTTNRQKKPSAQEQYLADKASGKRKAIANNSYAERSNAVQPAQSRAVNKGGKVIGSSYAAAGSAPSASERTAAKKRQERVADSLQKLQTDASYRAELAKPGRKLDSAEVEAVNQYVKNTKNTGFSGLKRVIDLAKNSDNLSKDEYAKKSAELNAELNQNSALRAKAQGNGAGQSAQAFTAGLYSSVPFLSKASDAMASAANATGLGAELPMLTKTLEDTKTYDPVATTLGTMAGKAMQYKLFNTLAAGTKYGKAAQAAGGKIGAAAQKIPGLGALVSDGFGDASGRVLADTGADLVLDTLPSLASDVSEGKSAGEVAGNAAKNLVGNVAMNALPEIGGAVFNRIKGAAGDAAQDALKQADSAAQEVQQTAPARNIVQPDANGTTGLAAQLQQMNTPDADNRSALNTLDELRGQVNLNGAQEKEAEQLRRAVLQRQQEIGNEAKLALQNSGNMPIDAATDIGYNNINNIGGVTNEAVQGRNQYDGTRSEGILRGSSNGTPQSGQRLAVGAETGEYLPANRVLVAEYLNQRPSVYNDSTRAIAEQAGAGAFDFRNSDDAPETFAQALATAKANNANGAAVDGHTAEEIANIVNNGGKTFLTPDGTAGGAVEANGNLTCVFKDATNNSTPGAGSSIALAAVNNGATKGDCYGRALVNMYSKAGLEPVARIPYAYGYNDAMDAQVRKQIADGIISKEPDVYALKLRDGYDFEKAAAEFNTAHRYTQAELDALPVYDDYDEMLAYRDSLLTAPPADTGVVSVMPDTAKSAAQSLPLNGSESVPEHAVGAASTQYDRREVLNQDYANQRGMTSGLNDAHLENLKTENTHQIWTDAEAKQQAKDDLSTYIQQAGGDENKALDNAMQDLRNKEHWNKGDSATADEIRYRLKTQFAQTQPGTPEYYTQKARYEAWNQKRSQIRSETAQTMQSFHGDASERINTVSKPITENWAKNNPAQDEKLKSLSDELAKLKDELRERDIADMEREAMQGVFGNDGAAAKPAAGDMDAEFGQMLKDNGIPSTAERVANFSDADKEKYKTATEEAYNKIVSRVKKLCEKNNVTIDDDAAKTIAGKIMNGDNAESYYNSLIMQAAGISDLSIDEMEIVDDLYSTAAKLPDSKERYDMEQQAIAIIAQHLPAADAFEKWDNVRFLAMLGNTTTHARNLLGNIGNMATTSAENKITALLQHTLPKEARTKALYTPAKMKTAAEEYIMNQRYSDLVGKTGTSDLTSSLQAGRKIYGDSIGGKMLQKLTDINSGLLAKEDDIFVKRGMVNSLASNLTAKGLDESIFSATDARSKQILDEAVTQAVRDAAEMTYHIDNAATEMLSKFSHLGDKRGSIGKKIGYCITNGLLPFAKTTANITKTSLTLNPVGAAVEGIYRAGTHKGAAAVMDSAAKGIVGTGLIAFGKWAADQGYLTGTLDADTKDYDEMTGKQEYSLHIPGVGSYTLDWLAPMAVPVMIGANLKDMSASDVVNTLLTDPTKFAGQVGDILLRAIDPISNMSIVQSVNRSLDNLKYAGDNGMGAAGTLLTNAATSYLQQYVPTMLGKVARTVDPVRRSSYGGGDSYTERNNSYLARSTLNKIPGLSMSNEPYIDQWGREQASLDGTDDSAGGMFLRGAYNMLSPGYIRQENITPVDEYLQGLYGSTNDSGVLPEKASNSVTVDSKTYYLTPEEKTQYAKTRGQISYDAVDSLRQNSLFLQLPEDQQNEIVKDVYTVATTVAAADTLGDGVSGTNSKAYKAYEQGGIPMLENYLLADSAVKDAGATKKADVARELLNSGLDSEGIYNSYILKYPKDQKAPAVYSQYGAEGAGNWLRYQAAADLDGNGKISQDEARATLDAMNLTDAQRAYYYFLTNSGWSAKNNPYGGA